MIRYVVEVDRASDDALPLTIFRPGDDSLLNQIAAIETARQQARRIGWAGHARIVRTEPVPGVEVLP